MSIRNEIKAQIVRVGFTMQELVDRLAEEYGYDIYELSCLARMCPEDVTANLAELKRKGYLQDK